MHKPAQVELQLDRPQLPYSETLGPIIAGGNPASYRRRQLNPTRKGPHTLLAASNSRITIEEGLWTFSERAAMISRAEFRLQLQSPPYQFH